MVKSRVPGEQRKLLQKEVNPLKMFLIPTKFLPK